MKNLINKLISRKLIYGLLVTVAVIGVIFITAKMYPNIKLSNDKKINVERESRGLILADVVAERSEKIAENADTKVTSRGSDVTRKTEAKNQENSAGNKDNSKEKDKTKKNSKKDTQAVVKAKAKDVTETKDKKEKKEKKDTTKYISKKDVTISKNMDLTKRTGLSRKDFIKLIAGVKYDTSGFFEENAGTIYDLCKKYSINEIFFCGLISAESGWNIASNHRKTHNYISLMSKGKLIQYGSVYEGLEVAAQKLHNNYLTPGGKFYHGKTLSGVKTNFCPASSTWVDLVYGRMKQILY